jgi:hypothetical protein
MKNNKNPLNISRDHNDNAATKRDNRNNLSQLKKDNQENYDTFSKNPSKSNIFQISKIDPQPI